MSTQLNGVVLHKISLQGRFIFWENATLNLMGDSLSDRCVVKVL